MLFIEAIKVENTLVVSKIISPLDLEFPEALTLMCPVTIVCCSIQASPLAKKEGPAVSGGQSDLERSTQLQALPQTPAGAHDGA